MLSGVYLVYLSSITLEKKVVILKPNFLRLSRCLSCVSLFLYQQLFHKCLPLSLQNAFCLIISRYVISQSR